MIICQGCGQSFGLPEGYSRNKIQCPGCGVICAVPAGVERAAAKGTPRPARQTARTEPEPAVEEQAAALFREPEPMPLFDDEPEPKPQPNPKPKPRRKEMLIPCRRCGKMIRKQRECPNCDGPVEESDAPDGSLELDEAPRPRVETEDDTPYQFSDQELPVCTNCRNDMPLGAVVCPKCGFNNKTQRQAVREYVPVDRTWDADMSLQTRLTILAAAEGVYLVTAIIAMAIAGLEPWGLVFCWALFTTLLCFVLGTYDRITLTRDRKGRTKLVIQWRAFFVPLKPVTTSVHGFEGVTTGQWHDAGFLEWFVFLNLLTLMIVPAIIWWYHAIYKPHFHVALALNHGHSEVYVYRGRSQEQMNDIADALCNASGLKRLA